MAIATAFGDVAVGNFIDDWQIQLAPYIELSAASASGPEGTGGSNSPANGPAIRIGGNVVTPVTATVQVTGGSAVIGTDYSLTPTFQSGNTTNTVVINIPPGVYDGTSSGSIFNIPFSISADSTLEPDEMVSLQLTGVTGATIAGIATCGTPVTNTSYTIINDDLMTAASVWVSGRVGIAGGRGLQNAIVTLTDHMGVQLGTLTKRRGFYSFNNVEAGQTYVIAVRSRRFTFTPQIITANDNLSGIDFVSQ